MQLKFQAAKLIEALDFVSIVEPRALTAQQNSAAFLFNCKTDDAGKPVCHVYSRGKEQVSRATFPLIELEGEGLFTMPSKHVDIIRKVPDDEITLESRTQTKTDGEAPLGERDELRAHDLRSAPHRSVRQGVRRRHEGHVRDLQRRCPARGSGNGTPVPSRPRQEGLRG